SEVTDTLWATRRPPNFTDREFDGQWGLEVERAVRERTLSGLAPASVVRTTGLPIRDEFREGVDSGALVSRGMLERVLPHGVHFPGQADTSQTVTAYALGPSASDRLAVRESWAPFPTERAEALAVIRWATGP